MWDWEYLNPSQLDNQSCGVIGCMGICHKKNSTPRRTIDFQPLNTHATRETHHTQSPFHLARLISQGKKKTIFRHMEWLPQCIPPPWRQTSHNLHHSLVSLRVLHRPTLQWQIHQEIRQNYLIHPKQGQMCAWHPPMIQLEESFHQAVNWLDICGKHGITLNPKNSRFPQDTVEFSGFEITHDTVRPCKKYTRAISDFPTPQNLTDE